MNLAHEDPFTQLVYIPLYVCDHMYMCPESPTKLTSDVYGWTLMLSFPPSPSFVASSSSSPLSHGTNWDIPTRSLLYNSSSRNTSEVSLSQNNFPLFCTVRADAFANVYRLDHSLPCIQHLLQNRQCLCGLLCCLHFNQIRSIFCLIPRQWDRAIFCIDGRYQVNFVLSLQIQK